MGGAAKISAVKTGAVKNSAARVRGLRGLVGAALAVAVLFAAGTKGELVSAKQAPSQQQTAPGQPSMTPPNLIGGGADPAISARTQEQQQRMAEDERHKRIVADTDKLLELATELKADVDKTNKNEMSMAVINKAAEIEKLSHDVKERMKN